MARAIPETQHRFLISEQSANISTDETDTYGHEGDEGIGFEFDDDRDSDEAGEVDVDDI